MSNVWIVIRTYRVYAERRNCLSRLPSVCAPKCPHHLSRKITYLFIMRSIMPRRETAFCGWGISDAQADGSGVGQFSRSTRTMHACMYMCACVCVCVRVCVRARARTYAWMHVCMLLYWISVLTGGCKDVRRCHFCCSLLCSSHFVRVQLATQVSVTNCLQSKLLTPSTSVSSTLSMLHTPCYLYFYINKHSNSNCCWTLYELLAVSKENKLSCHLGDKNSIVF
jgi:hypothetical protein